MDDPSTLTQLLHQTGYFQSIQECRILSQLITDPVKSSVKEICEEMGVPDSKIYPFLKSLEKLKLIRRDDSQRPNRFYFFNPQALFDFLTNHFQEEKIRKKELLSDIKSQVTNAWNPDEITLGQIAYLFKGKSIQDEIIRIQKQTDQRILYLLSSSFYSYIDQLKSGIPKLLKKGKRIEIAVPQTPEFIPFLEFLQNQPQSNLRIKHSVLRTHSYIVRDGNTMLNFTHRKVVDVAMLTNDPILVSLIDGCWKDSSCCIQNNIYHQVKLTSNVAE